MDLVSYGFFYPTTLLPLLTFLKNHSLKAIVDPRVHGYVSTLLNPSRSTTRSYIPFREFYPHNKLKRDKALLELTDLLDLDYGGLSAVEYLTYELTENMYKHSSFKNASIMAQRYPSKNFTEICFVDDGVSIPGNFSRCGLDFVDDADAIEQAVNGVSTQGEFNHRGWGLNNIVKMYKEANGEIFIASRRGAIYLSSNETNLYPLNNKYNMVGTLISLRIPKVKVDTSSYR